MIQKLALVVACAAAVLAAQAPTDREAFAKIRAEGLERSQAAPVFRVLTIDIGPRLTASPAHKRATEWMRDRLASYGLDHARLEPWHFGRVWSLEKLTVEMIEPRYLPRPPRHPHSGGELLVRTNLAGGRLTP